MLRDGQSWSGHEANRAFLNTRGARFADASAVLGLNHDSDSRGIAVTDWDQDGDLDLWVSNRTAPRLRFLQNETSDPARSVTIALQGVASNRDAVGARLELHTRSALSPETREDDGGTDPLIGRTNVQTLRAGDGYLSQSSKWIHFGLAGEEQIDKLIVRWPSGAVEAFSQLQPGGRYLIVEGQGSAQPLARRTSPSPLARASGAGPTEVAAASRTFRTADSPTEQAQTDSSEPALVSGSARVMAHRPLPLPPLPYLPLGTSDPASGDPAATSTLETSSPSSYQLISLWATWCQPCLRELAEFAAHRDALTQAKIAWRPLSVDDSQVANAGARRETVRPVAEQFHIASYAALATSDTVELLDVAQRVLVSKQDPLALPCSFLINESGDLVAVYKGPATVEQVVGDVGRLRSNRLDPRDYAVPFSGRWYTQPFPADLRAIPAKLLELKRPADAAAYLDANLRPGSLPAGFTAQQVAETYVMAAQELAQSRQYTAALHAFQQAAGFHPQAWAPFAGAAAIYEARGDYREAIANHRSALQNDPANLVSQNNLAFLLATAPEAGERNPAEALALAMQVCSQTNFRLAPALDTLAAAQAAAGQFDEAVETAQKAANLADAAGAKQLAARMRERSKRYQDHEPLILTPVDANQ